MDRLETSSSRLGLERTCNYAGAVDPWYLFTTLGDNVILEYALPGKVGHSIIFYATLFRKHIAFSFMGFTIFTSAWLRLALQLHHSIWRLVVCLQ